MRSSRSPLSGCFLQILEGYFNEHTIEGESYRKREAELAQKKRRAAP
jgi:hypothetical protein